MLKNVLITATSCLILCAGVKAEAAQIYVGMSPVTGYECYVLTDTIERYNEHRMVITSATPQDTPIEWAMYTVIKDY